MVLYSDGVSDEQFSFISKGTVLYKSSELMEQHQFGYFGAATENEVQWNRPREEGKRDLQASAKKGMDLPTNHKE